MVIMMSNKCRRLEEIHQMIINCTKCPLYKTRRNAVPGEGSCDAKLMFVGEAPGSREDELGRPFVGQAGKLLDTLLEMISIKRSEVFITNVVKCRPPGNRDPIEEEIATCSPYLIEQIKIIQPKIIVALGRHAARFLFTKAGLRWGNMKAMHGKVYDGVIEGVKVKLMATYHPAAALYSPKLRPLLERDFQEVLKPLYDRVSREEAEGAGTHRYKTILDFLGGSG